MRPLPADESAAAAALDYHHATKHRLDGYAPGPGFLDWDSQPDPFRRWPGAPAFELPLIEGTGRVSYEDLYRPQPEIAPLDERSLSLFLELALGLSAWKRLGPDRWALRNNPSSGNLHPTEGYVLLWRRLSEAIAPGLYHYEPYEHVLERRARLPDAQAQAFAAAHPAAFGVLAFSSIVWREEWKYGARAYRYCQLDAGHALGAARYAAATLGWALHIDPRPGDQQLARCIGLDRREDFAGAEPEQPELLALFGAGEPTAPDWSALAGALTEWRGSASRLSSERVEWPQIAQVLAAVAKPDQPQAGTWSAPASGAPLSPVKNSPDAATLIRSRRSAQRMDAKTGIGGDAFRRMMARTLPAAGTLPFDAFPYAPAIDLAIFVHDVEGLAPGLYALLRAAERGQSLLRSLRHAGFEGAAMESTGLPLYRLRAPEDSASACIRIELSSGHRGTGRVRACDAGRYGPRARR